MNPVNFLDSNTTYNPPDDYEGDAIEAIFAYKGQADGGPLDGYPVIVTAWKPSEEELAQLVAGGVVYMSQLSCGLHPHFLSTEFKFAAMLQPKNG